MQGGKLLLVGSTSARATSGASAGDGGGSSPSEGGSDSGAAEGEPPLLTIQGFNSALVATENNFVANVMSRSKDSEGYTTAKSMVDALVESAKQYLPLQVYGGRGGTEPIRPYPRLGDDLDDLVYGQASSESFFAQLIDLRDYQHWAELDAVYEIAREAFEAYEAQASEAKRNLRVAFDQLGPLRNDSLLFPECRRRVSRLYPKLLHMRTCGIAAREFAEGLAGEQKEEMVSFLAEHFD